MRVVPASLRWVSVLFGLASVPFLWIAVIDAHTATRMTQPSVLVDELILSAIQRLTYAVICIAIAVLPAIWSTFPRRYDSHQLEESPAAEPIR
jgi:hypothetical protein